MIGCTKQDRKERGNAARSQPSSFAVVVDLDGIEIHVTV